MAEVSPMIRQYMQIKQDYQDEILFFRLGDFYEMFFDDAKIASKELELTLTGRDCGQEERAPMCGVPYHSCDAYIARLVEKGYKVAICEQMEDPAKAKGIVQRKVVRVVTPGTVIEGNMLDEEKNNFLCTVFMEDKTAGVCFCDVSTGELHLTQVEGDNLVLKVTNELGRFAPREVVLNKKADENEELVRFLTDRIGCAISGTQEEHTYYQAAETLILSHFKQENLSDLSLDGKYSAVLALGITLSYLYQTQKKGLERISEIDLYTDTQYMRLDVNTRRNLELIETMRSKEKKGSLLWVLDKTKTAMGKRLLRQYIEKPLVNAAAITRRQNAVEELYHSTQMRGDLINVLAGVFDMERLMTRIVYGTANARDIRSLCFASSKLPDVRELIRNTKCLLLQDIYDRLDPLEDVSGLIDRALVDDPPITIKEGGIIRPGYNEEVDSLTSMLSDGRTFLAKIEADEREKTGIKNLKVGYNRVFGYYIEVSKSNTANVPQNYIRKQTLTNGERYITPELKEIEGKVLGAKDRLVALEYELFDDIRRQVSANLHRIQRTAQAVAELDVLCSLAQVAALNHYCRPAITLDGRVEIIQARHPVVEELSKTPFVPNDTLLDQNENRVAIITGPNMAGKSTYMRQVALCVLMAQMGSFVPAQHASIGLCDAIFTRVGASDDLASGQSTFMVEMNEVANILDNATKQSLLVFDEIGRGTSTFDGMSIARAVVEYAADKKKLGAKTLFATHYHELTDLEYLLDGIKNYNIAVKKRGDDITFLRRIVRGAADDSYGIEVAKLAGIPESVVNRAKEVLREIESGDGEPKRDYQVLDEPADTLMLGQSMAATALVDKLEKLDIDTLTPIEAMNALYELKKMLS